MDFSYLDQRMKQIDRSVRPEYTATYRLLKNGKLYGYRVEYSAIDAIDNPHQYDLSREQFNDFVARKIVRFVKMTSNGPTGYSGFELKKLPSINLDNKFRFEALLKAGDGFDVGYILRNISGYAETVNTIIVEPNGLFVLSLDRLIMLGNFSDCDGIALTGSVGNRKIYTPLFDNPPNWLLQRPIYITVKAPDGIYYIREPYSENIELKALISGMPQLSNVYTEVRTDVTKPLNYNEHKRFEKYLGELLAKDLQTQGGVGTAWQAAKMVSVKTNAYFSPFRDKEPDTPVANQISRPTTVQSTTNSQKQIGSTKGIKGLFDFFKRK